jgi:hypothetical protein
MIRFGLRMSVCLSSSIFNGRPGRLAIGLDSRSFRYLCLLLNMI